MKHFPVSLKRVSEKLTDDAQYRKSRNMQLLRLDNCEIEVQKYIQNFRRDTSRKDTRHILDKQGVKLWNGFNWLRMGLMEGFGISDIKTLCVTMELTLLGTCQQQSSVQSKGRRTPHRNEPNRTETDQQKYLPILFSELFRNRKLNSDPRDIVRTNSSRHIQYPKKNLRPEGHCLNI
jgi:hypothetical protein